MEPQSHCDETSTDIDSSRRRRSVEPVLMDTSAVAAMLNTSMSWVYREASKIGLKGYKLGRGRNAKVLYKRSEIVSGWNSRRSIRSGPWRARDVPVSVRHSQLLNRDSP